MERVANDLARETFVRTAWFVGILAVLLFLPALTLAWWQAWAFLAVFSASCIVTTVYFLKHDPGLVARRLRAGPQAEKEQSQKRIQTVMAALFILLFVFPGLDHRFGWSGVPAWISLVADLGVVLGFVVIFYVFKANSFAASTIEIGDTQHVVTTGPYAIVRHPMYAGALVMLACTPVALGSWWGLLLIVPVVGALAWRLIDEENFLVRNLDGYAAYRGQTRYRLVPGVW
jgi:protein-S-isoprenylcysteine O-methyltransferase Ste14